MHSQLAAGTGDLPAGLVAELVMPVAEQGAILVGGGAAIGPFDDVVGVAPGGSDGAAGPAAVPVAGDECEEQVLGHQPGFVTEVEDRRPGPGDHSVDAGVAGELADGGRVERCTDVGGAPLVSAFGDRFEWDGGQQLGVGPAAFDVALRAGVGQLGEGVGAALITGAGGAVVERHVHNAVERRADNGT